jgi:hypothetical protein
MACYPLKYVAADLHWLAGQGRIDPKVLLGRVGKFRRRTVRVLRGRVAGNSAAVVGDTVTVGDTLAVVDTVTVRISETSVRLQGGGYGSV